MRNHHQKKPIAPTCRLIEDDPVEYEEERLLSDAPSFPLEVFPEEIRNIVEALNEYENYKHRFHCGIIPDGLCRSYG